MNYAIIAAGQGSRLSGEGEALPKPLVTLGGRPMIERPVDILSRTGAESIRVIVNDRMTGVADCLSSLAATYPVSYVVRTTGGSMESFHELAKGLDRTQPFCLMTVDTVFRPEEFAQFISDFEADPEADGYMGVTTYVADEKPLFVAATPEGDITGFLDHPVPDVRYISGGIYALRPGALDILDDCAASGVSRMRDFQRALVAAGMRLKAWEFTKIIDVDHVGDLREARRFIADVPSSSLPKAQNN